MSIGKSSAWRLTVVVAAILATLATAGCREYKVEMRVAADGSGERLTTIDAEPDLSAESRALLGLTGGWQEKSVERDGKPQTEFTRRQAINRAGDWSRMTSDIFAASDPAGRATFANRVSVECRRGDAGRRCVYRETIAWRDLRETIADVYAEFLDRALHDSIPGLDPTTRAEIRGLTRGAVLLGWNDLVEAEGHEQGPETVIEFLAAEAGRLVRGGRASPEAQHVTQLIRRVCLDPNGGGLSSDPLNALPGVELTADSSLEMHVTLPGPIVESNADEIKDRTAIWRVDLSKALQGDIVLHAEADAGR